MILIAVSLVSSCIHHPAEEKTKATETTGPAQTEAPKAVGSIEVTSNPPGARVILIEIEEAGAGPPQPRGVTPVIIENVAPGNYTVHLEKPGYRFFQKDIKVTEGKPEKIAATLRKE